MEHGRARALERMRKKRPAEPTRGEQLSRLLDLAAQLERDSSPLLDGDGFWAVSNDRFGLLVTKHPEKTSQLVQLAESFQLVEGGGINQVTMTPTGWNVSDEVLVEPKQ